MGYVISFIKSFFAFCVGVVLIFLFYYYVSIPIIPCISIHLIALLLTDEKCLFFRRFFVVIGTLLGIACYLGNAILSITHFPAYLNILGIAFSFVTAFAFLTAGITMLMGLRGARNR